MKIAIENIEYFKKLFEKISNIKNSIESLEDDAFEKEFGKEFSVIDDQISKAYYHMVKARDTMKVALESAENESKPGAFVFFVKFSPDKINEGGWNSPYGKLYLDLKRPLGNYKKCIDGLDAVIDHHDQEQVFQYIGKLPGIEHPEEAWITLQNAYKSHPLHDRSMDTGDVILLNDKGYIVERNGFSELNEKQVAYFKSLL